MPNWFKIYQNLLFFATFTMNNNTFGVITALIEKHHMKRKKKNKKKKKHEQITLNIKKPPTNSLQC